MKHTKLTKSLSMLMAAVMSVQLFLPAVSHAVESAPAQQSGSVQTMNVQSKTGENRQFDDRDSFMKFSPEWNPYDESGHYNNTIMYTLTPGASLECTFRGTGAILYGQKTINSGMLEITVDGGEPTKVDFYDADTLGLKKVPAFKVENLDPNQEHTLRAVLLEEKNPAAGNRQVALDAIDILGYQAPPVNPELPDEAIIYESAFDKGEMGEWGHHESTKLELAQDAELNKQVLKITPSQHNEFIDLLSAGKIQDGRITFKIKSEQPLGQGAAVRHLSGENGTFATCWTNGWWMGDDTRGSWVEFSKAPRPAANQWHDVTMMVQGNHYTLVYDDVEWEGDQGNLNTGAGYYGVHIKDGENKHPVYLSDVVVTTVDPVRILPDTSKHDNTMKFWYEGPAYDWETEALPLGNGYMGAMVFGQVADEKIQINDKTLWIGGPGGVEDYTGGVREGAYKNLEPMREALRKGETSKLGILANGLIGKDLSTNGWGAYQNIGDILFHFENIGTGDVVTNYRRELDLNTGLAGVSYTHEGVNYDREYLVSYPDNVMAFHFTADQAGKLGFVLDPQIDTVYPAGQPDTPPNVDPSVPIKTFTRTAKGDLITVRGVLTENQMEFEVQYRVVTDGEVTANEDGTLTIAGAKDAVVYVATGTNYANESMQWTDLHNPPDYRGEDPHADVTARIDNAVKKGYEAIKVDHVADVNGVMGRVELDIAQGENDVPTDKLVSGYGGNDRYDRMAEMLMFQFGRYLILGSSRTGSLPANLQGVWNNSNKPAWSGDYHCNVNLQMNYWPTGIANVAEAGQSLVDYIETIVVPGRFTAAEHHGVRGGGWTVHTSNNPFGMTAPGWSFYWGWSPAANAWICQNLWDHFQFTQDKEVLKDQIYPIMREAAEFWTKNLVDDGKGGLVSSPTYSSEHGPITAGNTYDQSLVYQLMQDTVEAAKVLGIRDTEDKEFCDQLTDIMGKLNPYSVGKWGQIKEWREEDEWPNRGFDTMSVQKGHRHMSHMLGLYPGNQITRDTPELLEAAKVTLTDRGDGGTGWSKALKVSNWARVGDGNHALKIFSEFLKHNVYTNMFAYHPPFQIDGNLGITAGAAEMLLQSHTGYIQPLPALPDAWSAEGSVKGLVARGNFVVDMSWADAALQTMDITARSGGTCQVYLPDFAGNMPTDSKGQPVKGTYENDILSFETVKGETYHYTTELNAEDVAAAAAVDQLIAAIGDVTLDSEGKIQEAREAYEALTEGQQALVTKLDVLTAAEEELKNLQEQGDKDQQAAAALDEQIAAIGEVTLDSEAQIKAARKTYNNMTRAQQALVKNLDILKAAERKLADLKKGFDFHDVSEDDWFYEGVRYTTLKGMFVGIADKTFGPAEKVTRATLVQVLYSYAGKPKVEKTDRFSDVHDGDWFANAVAWAVEEGITAGVGNGKFAPDEVITREQVAVMLHGYAKKPAADTELDFVDAGDVSAWAENALKWAVENKLMGSVDKNVKRLAPQATATRAEAAVIMMQFDKL